MYKIKPVNGIIFSSLNGELSSPTINKRVKMEPELQAIEERQLEVIAKLKSLNARVDGLMKNVVGGGGGGKVSAKSNSPSRNASANSVQVSSNVSNSSAFALVDVDVPSEVVIEANPNRPPLSVVFFRHLYPSLRTLSHTHSSCQEQVDKKLTSLFSRGEESACSTVRIVWKNMPGM